MPHSICEADLRQNQVAGLVACTAFATFCQLGRARKMRLFPAAGVYVVQSRAHSVQAEGTARLRKQMCPYYCLGVATNMPYCLSHAGLIAVRLLFCVLLGQGKKKNKQAHETCSTCPWTVAQGVAHEQSCRIGCSLSFIFTNILLIFIFWKQSLRWR